MKGLAAVIVLCAASIAFGYRNDFHRVVSADALLASQLGSDPTVMGDLGLRSTKAQVFPDPLNEDKQRSILDLIGTGSVHEDEVLWKKAVPKASVVNHFFDPVHDAPLFALVGNRSPGWALGTEGENPNSYEQARLQMLRTWRSHSTPATKFI